MSVSNIALTVCAAPSETRLKAELDSLRNQLADQSACLRLAHTLNEFLERLRTQAQTLDVLARQRVIRLIVKEIVVGNDSIAIRHSIPNSPRSSGGPTGEVGPGQTSPGSGATTSSLLCTWRDNPALRRSCFGGEQHALVYESRMQPLAQNDLVHRDMLQQPVMADVVEGSIHTLPLPKTSPLLCASCVGDMPSRDMNFVFSAAASEPGRFSSC